MGGSRINLSLILDTSSIILLSNPCEALAERDGVGAESSTLGETRCFLQQNIMLYSALITLNWVFSFRFRFLL